MKKITVLLFALVALNCAAQDSEYLKLWNQYIDECNEIVLDTLTEHGTVTYEISQQDGDIKLIPKDTTWNNVTCPEYKELYWDNLTLGTFGDVSYTLATTTVGTYSLSQPTAPQFTTHIERTKICSVKQRYPTQDNFWQWLKDMGYRK